MNMQPLSELGREGWAITAADEAIDQLYAAQNERIAWLMRAGEQAKKFNEESKLD